MIVRIVGEGQYDVDAALVERLNRLDNQLAAAVDGEDAAQFDRVFHELLALVQSDGRRLADDELAPSDVVLPSSDATFSEVRALFTGEGLVPG